MKKNKYNSKEFYFDNYFTLYDSNDNFIAYFDNYEELKKITNRTLQSIVYSFNNSKYNYIFLRLPFLHIKQNRYTSDLENIYFKLYTFTDL